MFYHVYYASSSPFPASYCLFLHLSPISTGTYASPPPLITTYMLPYRFRSFSVTAYSSLPPTIAPYHCLCIPLPSDRSMLISIPVQHLQSLTVAAYASLPVTLYASLSRPIAPCYCMYPSSATCLIIFCAKFFTLVRSPGMRQKSKMFRY